VGVSVALPALFAAGLYIKTSRTRTAQRQAAVQMVRDEEKRRGVVATDSAPALDPVSKYIVILRSGGADPDSQREAAWRLGEMRQGAIDAVPTLLNALKSPAMRVRESSAEALMKVDGQNPAVVSAVKELFNDPSAEVWGAVLRVFAQKGDADANKALVTKITSPDVASRSKACEILGSLTSNPSFAAPPIIALLKVETDHWVLRGCSHSLGNLGQGSPEAIAALEHVLASTSQPDVTRTATEVLAKLKRGGK
jgi:HEAT repeat protein